MKKKVHAFIPARSGSKRVPDKNIRELGGVPLLAHTVKLCVDSEMFDKVICVTDSSHYADIAKGFGAEVPLLRPSKIASDVSPDIDWVLWVLDILKENEEEPEHFFLMRPTSPFRSIEMLKKAWKQYLTLKPDSLRAVELCKQHPGKMWELEGSRMKPLLPYSLDNTPWHSSQYANLPDIYVQNASLEIISVEAVREQKTISGTDIIPFFTQGYEGFDINDMADFEMAETIFSSKERET